MQQHRHTFTCRKEKGVACCFNALWPPSDETRIVRGTNFCEEKLKRSKKILNKVLSEIIMTDDATLTNVLDGCGVTEHEYIQALETMRRKISIIFKRKPNETMILNLMLLNLMKSNMNLQFVTGIYGLLAYLC